MLHEFLEVPRASWKFHEPLGGIKIFFASSTSILEVPRAFWTFRKHFGSSQIFLEIPRTSCRLYEFLASFTSSSTKFLAVRKNLGKSTNLFENSWTFGRFLEFLGNFTNFLEMSKFVWMFHQFIGLFTNFKTVPRVSWKWQEFVGRFTIFLKFHELLGNSPNFWKFHKLLGCSTNFMEVSWSPCVLLPLSTLHTLQNSLSSLLYLSPRFTTRLDAGKL